MKKNIVRAAMLAGCMTVLGCATAPGQCDVNNSDVSLIGKAMCDKQYAQQEKDARLNLQKAKEENAAFHAALEALEVEKAAVGKGLQDRQQAHDKAQAALKAALQKVKARQGHKADVQQQIAQLEQQLQAQSQLPTSNSQAILKQREKERDELRRKVNELQLSLGY